ncbi:LysR substrate-binding domain-containing protein [Kerstersia sp.]|uniref:LysR substrate-binding domain-containing protein n=1 Tax=Kerstersia sp. TaxID=1930783 RepID=UPI003F924040
MRHLSTDSLATLVAVVDHGSFTIAAERLGKTQAAVSLVISRMEEQLGRRLLERQRKQLALTQQGEILLGYARRMLNLENEALCALHCDQGSDHVRIGMPDDYLDVLGNVLLRDFRQRYPDAQVDIICDFSSRLEKSLNQGELDLAIVTRDPQRPIGTLLCREPQVWCNAGEHRPEKEAVLPLALFADQCRARPHILASLDEAGRAWRIACASSHLPGVQMAVRLNGALTVLPAAILPAGWRILDQRHGLPPLPELELALLMPDDARFTARRLAHFLQEHFQRQAHRLAA